MEWIRIEQAGKRNQNIKQIDVRIKLTDGSELNCWAQEDGDFWNETLGKFITQDQVTHYLIITETKPFEGDQGATMGKSF